MRRLVVALSILALLQTAALLLIPDRSKEYLAMSTRAVENTDRALKAAQNWKELYEMASKSRDKNMASAVRGLEAAEKWQKLYKEHCPVPVEPRVYEENGHPVLDLTGVTSIGTVTALTGEITAADIGPLKYICKQVSVPSGDGCNSCAATRCHDDKEQWDEPGVVCTLMACPPKKQPYNPKDWQEENKL